MVRQRWGPATPNNLGLEGEQKPSKHRAQAWKQDQESHTIICWVSVINQLPVSIRARTHSEQVSVQPPAVLGCVS